MPGSRCVALDTRNQRILIAWNARLADGARRASGRLRLTRPRYGHDCKPSECKPRVCKPMAESTIRMIRSILSGIPAVRQRAGSHVITDPVGVPPGPGT
jgi:hypothetical protein